MKCSNCGKDIPFAGKVCPWCHANKQGDQALHAMSVLGVLAGAGVSFGLLNLESFISKLEVTLLIAVPFVILGAMAKRKIDRGQHPPGHR